MLQRVGFLAQTPRICFPVFCSGVGVWELLSGLPDDVGWGPDAILQRLRDLVSRLQELVSRFFPVELLSGLPDDVGLGPDAILTKSWFIGARLLRELVSRLQESVSRFCPVSYLHACLTSGTPDVRWGIGPSDTFSTGFQEMRYGVLCIYIYVQIYIFLWLDYIYIYVYLVFNLLLAYTVRLFFRGGALVCLCCSVALIVPSF